MVYEAVVAGTRGQDVQHFPLAAEDGSLHGPFGVMLHAPEIGTVLQELGAAIRFRSDLTARCREIAVLQVAQALASEFEWWAHVRVGKAVGLTDAELMALSLGSLCSDDPVEAAVLAFCANLLHSNVVTDEAFAAASAVLSDRQIIDLTVLVGYYRTLAQLMCVFDIGVPDAEDTAVGPDRHAQ